MKKMMSPRRLTVKTDQSMSRAEEILTTQILGGTLLLSEPGLKVFKLPDGTVMEFFGRGSFPPEHIFNSGNVVPGFVVNDLMRTISELQTSGATLLNEVEWILPGQGYCHMAISKCLTIGLFQSEKSPLRD